MFKLSHSQLVAASGIVWFLTGLFLAQFGARLLIGALPTPEPFVPWTHPLLESFASLAGSRENVAVLIVLGCLITGQVKCRFVLSRSIKRGIKRILALPNPAPLYRIYSLPYYGLIGCMILMGVFLRKSGLPDDLRGACYLSIGFGMLRGAALYFKQSFVIRDSPSQGESAVELFD